MSFRDSDADTKKLAIIVPYRDRWEHLNVFVPHMVDFFARDDRSKHREYSVHIVEQAGDGAFNRGKLLNCGFALTKESNDYFCFHDVDYLPIHADYSYCTAPTRLVWYGAEHALRVPGKFVVHHRYDEFFGGVVMFNKGDFERVNGFSNEYRGWGYEDMELRVRTEIEGLAFHKRDGTYRRLDHKHSGYNEDGSETEQCKLNKSLYQRRIPKLHSHALHKKDGLSNLSFANVDTKILKLTRNNKDSLLENYYLRKVVI